MARTSALLTRMPFESNGALSKNTIYSASKAKERSYYPVKSSDLPLCNVTRYGGRTAASVCYFFLISHEKKGKTVLCIESLPAFYRPIVNRKPDGLKWFCEDLLGYMNVKILIPKIRIQSVLEINGYRVFLSGKSSIQISVRNAEQMFLPEPMTAYVRHIEKHAPLLLAVQKRNPQKLAQVNLHDRDLSAETNIVLYDALTDKYRDSLFARRPCPIGERLYMDRIRFVELSIPEQCLILYQMLKLGRIGINMADMSLVGDGRYFGKMMISQNIDYQNDAVFLISQSPTGLKESKIRLSPDLCLD